MPPSLAGGETAGGALRHRRARARPVASLSPLERGRFCSPGRVGRDLILFFVVVLAACGREPEGTLIRLGEHPELLRWAGEPGPLDVGSTAARQFLTSGWSGDERWADSGTSFAWSVGSESLLRLPRIAARSLELRFRCRPLAVVGAGPQSVTTLFNGQVVDTIQLVNAFETYSIAVPERLVHAGDNEVAFRYAYHRAPRDLGGEDSRQLAVAWDWIGALDRPAEDRLRLFPGARLELDLELPRGASLLWDGIAGPRGSGIRLGARWWTVGGGGARKWEIRSAQGPTRIDLSPAEGVVRLSLEVAPSDGAPSVDNAALIAPRIAIPSSIASTPSPAARVESRSPNVLIYLVDTLRADRVGAQRGARQLTPNADLLADDGILFENAFSHSGWTRTSVASLLSGTTPWIHGAVGRQDSLSADVPFLPDLLANRGYQTVGISSNDNVSADFGFARGFQTWRNLYPSPPSKDFATSMEVTRAFRDWLSKVRRPGVPFFAYLHTADPHDPYRPGAEFRQQFARGPYRTTLDVPATEQIRRFLDSHPGISAEEVRRQLAEQYDAEVAQNDASFGDVLTLLKDAGIYDNTMIVFTADHGEEFLEHGAWGHGHSLYTELVHVPLIIKLPGQERGGERVATPVRHLDVLPTVLTAAGLPTPASLEGQSLHPRPTTGQQPAFSYLWLDGPEVLSLIEQGHHLVVFRGSGPATVHLFNLQLDPREQDDRAHQEPLLTACLLRQLEAYQTKTIATKRYQPSPVSGEMRARLRALGYLP